ncbi:MAG TPA: hypothetical protein VFS36_02945 [Chitinophagaceae bacterium]|jgi:hypothetical protein|nr:hypothetical protein [Chitinophagaceae bacterium]
MKKLLLMICIAAGTSVFSQDTTKVEQYCELVAQGRLFSTKVTIDINFGEERKYFSGDKRLRDEISGKVKKFNSVTDALNYMGLQGWSLVNAFPMGDASNQKVYHFYFKKLFNKEDILKEQNGE